MFRTTATLLHAIRTSTTFLVDIISFGHTEFRCLTSDHQAAKAKVRELYNDSVVTKLLDRIEEVESSDIPESSKQLILDKLNKALIEVLA